MQLCFYDSNPTHGSKALQITQYYKRWDLECMELQVHMAPPENWRFFNLVVINLILLRRECIHLLKIRVNVI